MLTFKMVITQVGKKKCKYKKPGKGKDKLLVINTGLIQGLQKRKSIAEGKYLILNKFMLVDIIKYYI